MKKVLIASAIAASLASSAAFADHGVLPHEGSVYGGVALVDVGLSDEAIAVKGGYNHALDAVLPGLSIDAELAFSVADAEEGDWEASYWSAGTYARYTYGLDTLVQGLDIYGRLGGAYVSAEAEGYGVKLDDSSFDLAYGVGVGYELQKDLTVYVDYTNVDNDLVDLGELSAGVQLKF